MLYPDLAVPVSSHRQGNRLMPAWLCGAANELLGNFGN